jgi:D-arabinose 1-dehydrogenase-like Zn-dependent alcohol dehydrogenase
MTIPTSITTMKASRFAEFGPPSVLRIEEVAIPEPGEGEALVHLKAAAINPSDIADVSGREEVWGSSPNLGNAEGVGGENEAGRCARRAAGTRRMKWHKGEPQKFRMYFCSQWCRSRHRECAVCRGNKLLLFSV